MPEIIEESQESQNFMVKTWNKIKAKSSFVKFSVLAIALFIIATPFVVKNTQTTKNKASNQSQVYWGAWISGTTYGSTYGTPPWDSNTWNLFEQHTQKTVSIIHFGTPWYMSQSWPNGYYPFEPTLMDNIRNRGAIPLLDWASWDGSNHTINQPDFSLKNIANGANYTYGGETFDTYITQFAQAAKNWGHPFFLRFDWEMNGNWQFPWSAQLNGNTPADYVAAWKHVHDIFTQVGATNVTWVWCPNVEGNLTTPLNQLYPGNNYVDWTCLDGYNKGSTWASFHDIYSSSTFNSNHDSYIDINTVSNNKPLMIGEFASKEDSTDPTRKASWINDAIGTQIPLNYPNIKAIVWFNWNNSDGNFAIESSTNSQNAFATSIASSYYASANGFLPLTDLQPVPAIPSASSTSTPTPTQAPSAQNYLLNSSFDATSLSPWVLNVKTGALGALSQDSSTKIDGIYSAKVDVTQSSSTDWYLQLAQGNIPLNSTQTYTVTFWAKSSAGGNISTNIQDVLSPYTIYNHQNFALTTSWQKYTYVFAPSATSSNTALRFNLASIPGSVWIDDVVVSSTTSSNPLPTSTPTLTPKPTLTPTPTVLFDTTSPTVSIVAPLNGQSVSRHTLYTISANASDNVGVTKVIIITSSGTSCTLVTAPYNCNWYIPNSRNVIYTIKATAYDAAQNSASSSINVVAR